MNDCLIVYIKKDIIRIINKESIMQWFQNIKPRKKQL